MRVQALELDFTTLEAEIMKNQKKAADRERALKVMHETRDYTDRLLAIAREHQLKPPQQN